MREIFTNRTKVPEGLPIFANRVVLGMLCKSNTIEVSSRVPKTGPLLQFQEPPGPTTPAEAPADAHDAAHQKTFVMEPA